MARVSVDETIYANIPIIQMYVSWDFPKIIGHLVLLWRFSQDKGRENGTVEEIGKWAWLTQEKEQFIQGLIHAELITPDEKVPTLFTIRGNSKHISKFMEYREKAKKAADARWGNISIGNNLGNPGNPGNEPIPDAPSIPQACSEHAPSIPQACIEKENDASSKTSDALFYSILPSSIQFDSNLKNKKENKKGKPPGIRLDYPQEFEELWNLYGKRGDKKAALQEFKALQLSQNEQQDLKTATLNYSGRTEFKFRLHFYRFLKTDWREELQIAEVHSIGFTDQQKKFILGG